MQTDDKEKLRANLKEAGGEFAFAVKLLSLFNENEEVSTRELSKRSRIINGGHRFNKNWINKVLNSDLQDVVEARGRNKWRLKKEA